MQSAVDIICDTAKSDIYKSFGTVKENSTRSALEARLGEGVRVVKENQYKSMMIYQPPSQQSPRCGGGNGRRARTWFIGGYIDGLVMSSSNSATAADGADAAVAIVEIKNRQSRIFERVPFYEQVQCECYMRIWRADELLFVQHLRAGGVGTEKFSVKKVHPDEDLWFNKILAPLRVAIDSYEHMCATPKLVRSLIGEWNKLDTERDKKFVKKNIYPYVSAEE